MSRAEDKCSDIHMNHFIFITKSNTHFTTSVFRLKRTAEKMSCDQENKSVERTSYEQTHILKPHQAAKCWAWSDIQPKEHHPHNASMTKPQTCMFKCKIIKKKLKKDSGSQSGGQTPQGGHWAVAKETISISAFSVYLSE